MPLRKVIPALFALIAALCAVTAHAGTPDAVTVEFTPASIQLGAGDCTQVLLVIRNNTASALQNIQIHWLTDLDLKVTPQGDAPAAMKPHSVFVWPVTIAQAVAGRSVGKLNFWTTYDTADSSSALAVASLDIAEKPALSVDKLVTLKLESAIDQFDEKHPANLYLVVTNTSAIPVTVTKIHADNPGFLTLDPTPAGNTVLPPSASKTFMVVASAKDTSPTGTQRIILDADLAWIDAGKPQTSTISVATTLPVSVLGESDLLKLIGVPSFLFLPGFLAIAIFTAIWSRSKEEGFPELKLSVAETAVAAVTLSIVAAPIYSWWTGRDYLSGYGLRDVFWVWVGSIGAGAAAWLILFAIFTWRRRTKARNTAEKAARIAAENAARLAEITPTRNDTPIQLLARMQLVHREPPPPQTLVTLPNAAKTRAFLLMPGDVPGFPADSPAWVTPPIALIRSAQVDPDWTRPRLIERLKEPGIFEDYDKLTTLLKQAKSAGWKVEWGCSGSISHPVAASAAELEDAAYAKGFTFIRI